MIFSCCFCQSAHIFAALAASGSIREKAQSEFSRSFFERPSRGELKEMNVDGEVKGKQDDTAKNKTTCCRWADRVKGRFILMKSRAPLVSPCVSAWACAGICTCDESSLGQFDGCWNSKRRSSLHSPLPRRSNLLVPL